MKNLMLDIEDLLKVQAEAIDNNDSYGALIAVCEYFELDVMAKKVALLEQIHDLDGHLTDEVRAIRTTYQNQVIETIKKINTVYEVTEEEIEKIKHYL